MFHKAKQFIIPFILSICFTTMFARCGMGTTGSHLSSFTKETSQEKAFPRLILHVDINKTLIASDKVSNKSSHDVVSAAIAETVFDHWDSSLLGPISYFDYVKYHLCPDLERNPRIKEQQKRQISQVMVVLKERGHPKYEQAKLVYEKAMRALESQESMIFPSFYQLIDYLHEKQIPFTLVLRSFGPDAPEIATELNQKYGKEFLYDFFQMKQASFITEEGEKELYSYVKTAPHHFSIRDDWEYWYKHHEEGMYGKRFPIDIENTEEISLFFDDNAKLDLDRPEHNALAPYDPATNQPLSVSDLIEKRRILPVDMLEALLDEQYFVRFVEQALASTSSDP